MKHFFKPKAWLILFFMVVFGVFFSVLIVSVDFWDDSKESLAADWDPVTGTGDNVWGWAWASTIGWISLNKGDCDEPGYEVCRDNVTREALNFSCTGHPGPSPCTAVAGRECVDWCEVCDNNPIPPIICDNNVDCGGGTCVDRDYGVRIGTSTAALGHFSGYAWSNNVGWISFDRADTGNPPAPPFNGGVGRIARYEYADPAPIDKPVIGWAKILALGNEGWIRFDHVMADPVTIDISTGDFSGYAWNENVPANTGIGWISFNADNCDNNGVIYLGTPAGCPIAGTLFFDYWVEADVNTAPTAMSLTAPNWNEADACVSPAGAFGQARGARLTWDFIDPDFGSYGTAYQVILQQDGGPVVFNSGKCTAQLPAPSKCKINPVNCMGILSAPCHNPGDCACTYRLDETELTLYNTKYRWSVTVWDNFDVPSAAPANYSGPLDTDNEDGDPNTFTTYAREFPIVNPLSYFPKWPSSSQGEEIMFFGTSSLVYLNIAPSGPPISCGYSNTTCNWDWSATNAVFKPPVPVGNATATPIITFSNIDKQDITLRVIDGVNPPIVGVPKYYCQRSFPASATTTLKLPSWIETK